MKQKNKFFYYAVIILYLNKNRISTYIRCFSRYETYRPYETVIILFDTAECSLHIMSAAISQTMEIRFCWQYWNIPKKYLDLTVDKSYSINKQNKPNTLFFKSNI